MCYTNKFDFDFDFIQWSKAGTLLAPKLTHVHKHARAAGPDEEGKELKYVV